MKAAEYERAFGSDERVQWFKAQPCFACGVVGYSQNAHIPEARGRGASRRGDADQIVPACGPRPRLPSDPQPEKQSMYPGCHYRMDEERSAFFAQYPKLNCKAEAARYDALWMQQQPEVRF